ncbi:IS5 family transposase [Burkholderia sp. Bp8986]|uniref:IS5 family transposase n=1 Tax=Burkholderia sp. Bp8986 TaxID=2184550 RepID=UPI000F5A99BC|nr:IS5 family transposase [Burkholderia sp. Bp8986]RQS40345.1 IS5 family transposase [Burkholderia sp. Bp8986]
MPHKHNADRRHQIPRMSFKVQNWAEYEAGLRRRGGLTLWIDEDALRNWQSCGPNGQRRYSAVAIQTCLMLRTAFRMALRQAEGLLGSVITLMGLSLSAPDHTTVSRRALTLPALPREVPAGPLDILIDSTGLQVFGAGQWLQEKHGTKSRRSWRKLHLAVDAGTGMIVSHTLTDQHADDPSQVAPLLDQIGGVIARVIADGAYDGAPTYPKVARHGDGIQVVIPPRPTAVASCELGPPTRRDRHLAVIREHRRRLGWQQATGYGRRALVETTMGRYKAIIGARLRARGFAAQRAEAAIGVAVLNCMLAAARPKSARRERATA